MNARIVSLAALLLIAFTTACASEPAAAPQTTEPALTTDTDKTLYSLGLLLGQRVTSFRLTEDEMALVRLGFEDGALGRPHRCELSQFGPKVNELAGERAKAAAGDNKKAGQAFLDKVAAEEGIKKTGTGLLMKTITEGTGPSPASTDRVKVNYRGTLTDGTEFDSSYKRGEPAEFALNQVIGCWTEGLQFIKVGGKATLYCPADLAYGDQGAGAIPPGSALIFEVELLEIVK